MSLNCPWCASEQFRKGDMFPLRAKCDNCGSEYKLVPIEIRDDNIKRER